MDHLSDPVMRVISKLGGPAVNAGLERERCAWAWDMYERTGEVKYLGSWDYFATRWQQATGAQVDFSNKVAALRAMEILTEPGHGNV